MFAQRLLLQEPVRRLPKSRYSILYITYLESLNGATNLSSRGWVRAIQLRGENFERKVLQIHDILIPLAGKWCVISWDVQRNHWCICRPSQAKWTVACGRISQCTSQTACLNEWDSPNCCRPERKPVHKLLTTLQEYQANTKTGINKVSCESRLSTGLPVLYCEHTSC